MRQLLLPFDVGFPEGTPVLFADFDGVISINQPSFGPRLTAAERLKPVHVARLNEIVRRTSCLVVVSSTWRENGIDNLRRWLGDAGYQHEICGTTPVHGHYTYADEIEAHRGREILAWVEAQPVKPRAIAVLDDLALRGPVSTVLVQTDGVGLSDADVERAVDLLSRRGREVRPWDPVRESPSASSPRASRAASPGRSPRRARAAP